MLKMIQLVVRTQVLRVLQAAHLCTHFRCNATDSSTTKQLAVQGTENEHRMRVRRARVNDVPRVLDFVRTHARLAWPYLAPAAARAHSTPSYIAFNDYVARALAQGHTMLAEQFEPRRGWEGVRGVSLNAVLCPWDAALVDRWARCILCPQSRQFLTFTAQCLREPALFEKYKVKNMMQINLIVPPSTHRSAEVAKILAKNSMQRGVDIGYSRLRFDITTDEMAKALEDLKLTKEWQMKYKFQTEDACTPEGYTSAPSPPQTGNKSVYHQTVTVYTASPVLKREAAKS